MNIARAYELAVHQTLELDSMKPRKLREYNFKRRLKEEKEKMREKKK
jgi:hypothetical protein